MQRSVRNVRAKFKVGRLSCFCSGARQKFTSQKPFPSEREIPETTMRTATSKLKDFVFMQQHT